MRRTATIALSILVMLIAAGPVRAQNYRSPRYPEQSAQNEEGRARTPDEPEELPENQQVIPPPPEGAPSEPEPVEDRSFRRAAHEAGQRLVVIRAARHERAIGFLIDGPDEEHKLVVTNFLAVAPKDYDHRHWVQVRLPNGTKLEVDRLWNHNEVQDLALISVEAPKSRDARVLTLAPENPKPEATVYAVGHSEDGWGDWACPGKVLGIVEGNNVDGPPGSRWVQTDRVVTQATVHGPLVDERGRVVGLCTSAGRHGAGPYLSAPVSAIRALADEPSFGSGRFPVPKGAFEWSDSDPRKPNRYTAPRARAAVRGMARTLECSRCDGHGYLVIPQYERDPRTGRKSKTGEKREICDACGGAGVVVRPSFRELLSSLAEYVIHVEPEADEDELAQLKTLAREAADRAAVNRLPLARYLAPKAGRMLADPVRSRGEGVAFVATVGPTTRTRGGRREIEIQWVKPYDSDAWVAARGASPRSAASPPSPRNSGRRGRRTRSRAGSDYVLVLGVVDGYTTVRDRRDLYRAPALRAADIVTLRPGFRP